MVIKMINNFEKEIDKVRNDIDKDISFFNNYLKKLSTQSKTEEEKEQLEQIKNNIRYAEDMIKWTKCKKESVREPSLEDINEREQLNKFMNDVDNVIPDDDPLVFHGNGNISMVKEIIRSGSLLTQEDRGYSISWSSSIICASSKSDISQSIMFANSYRNYYLPYGALFVIAPKDDMQKGVFKGAINTNIIIPLYSINFHLEPKRLVAIITTNENINDLKKIAKENKLNENLIMNHNDFIKMCKNKYSKNRNTYC